MGAKNQYIRVFRSSGRNEPKKKAWTKNVTRICHFWRSITRHRFCAVVKKKNPTSTRCTQLKSGRDQHTASGPDWSGAGYKRPVRERVHFRVEFLLSNGCVCVRAEKSVRGRRLYGICYLFLLINSSNEGKKIVSEVVLSTRNGRESER